MGWLLDDGATQRRIADRSNVADMADDPFYQVHPGPVQLRPPAWEGSVRRRALGALMAWGSRCYVLPSPTTSSDKEDAARTSPHPHTRAHKQHLAKHFGLHATAQLATLFLLGGLPALVWVGAVRLVVVYHITWFVNSAAHVWGSQAYDTGERTWVGDGGDDASGWESSTGWSGAGDMSNSVTWRVGQHYLFDGRGAVADHTSFPPSHLQATCRGTTGGWACWRSEKAGTSESGMYITVSRREVCPLCAGQQACRLRW